MFHLPEACPQPARHYTRRIFSLDIPLSCANDAGIVTATEYASFLNRPGMAFVSGDDELNTRPQASPVPASATAPPPPVDTIIKRRQPHRNIHKAALDRISPLDRVALWITVRVGSMGFFLTIFGWTACWLGWNLLAPARLQFDPPMAFVFWLFISNVIQILLMPLIMVGQNLLSRHAELRAEHDLNINIQAEREIEAILRNLEYQNNLLLAMVRKLEVDVDTARRDPKV